MTTLDNIARALSLYAPTQTRGDHTLNPDFPALPPFRKASVLIPLLARPEGVNVLFTQRTSHLHTHAGQVSFPGGGAEPHDADEIVTALRESEEEIGLDPQNVRILGTLDHYITRSGFCVRPVVGLVLQDQEWRPDSFEVANIFEVPLPYILEPGRLCEECVDLEGITRRYYACRYDEYYIWGATAGMLRNFVEVISEK